LVSQAIQWLERYPWPGNVRELENKMRQLVALGHREASGADLDALSQAGPRSRAHGERRFTLAEAISGAERLAIREALIQCAGNKSKAAQLLGVTRKALYRRLVTYGMLTKRRDARLDEPDAEPGKMPEKRAAGKVLEGS
jgi:DNA-binding NtrC family response regulator